MRNNIGFPNDNTNMGGVDSKFNTWDLNITPSSNDFASVADAGCMGPRQPDGSPPNLDFMKLHTGSHMIDKGTDVGLPYVGVAPDLGAYEFGATGSSGMGGSSAGGTNATGGTSARRVFHFGSWRKRHRRRRDNDFWRTRAYLGNWSRIDGKHWRLQLPHLREFIKCTSLEFPWSIGFGAALAAPPRFKVNIRAARRSSRDSTTFTFMFASPIGLRSP